MCNVNGEKVWGVLRKDPSFLTYVCEPQRAVFEPFVKALPEVLKDLLDKAVSIEMIMQTRAAVLRYLLEHDFAQKAVAATPNELFLVPRDEAVEVVELDLRRSLHIIELALKSPSIAALSGLPAETKVTLGLIPHLNRRNLRKFKNGKLTIRDLLLSQPVIFL